jgi:hypothetical protein
MDSLGPFGRRTDIPPARNRRLGRRRHPARLLQLGGQDVMAEPWTDRRKRLDVFAAGISEPRLQLVSVSDDAARLWTVWVIEWGSEGIVLKDRRSTYKPGARSRCWWQAKNKLILPVEVLPCADTPVPVGRLGPGTGGTVPWGAEGSGSTSGGSSHTAGLVCGRHLPRRGHGDLDPGAPPKHRRNDAMGPSL